MIRLRRLIFVGLPGTIYDVFVVDLDSPRDSDLGLEASRSFRQMLFRGPLQYKFRLGLKKYSGTTYVIEASRDDHITRFGVWPIIINSGWMSYLFITEDIFGTGAHHSKTT